MNESDLLKNLAFLGLDETEVQILIEISKHKPITAVQLARTSKMPKTTVYRYLDALVAKSFITTVVSTRGREFTLSPTVFEMKLSEAKLRYDKINEMKPTLENALFSHQGLVGNTSTRIYDTIDGAKQLIWNCLSAKSTIYYYTSANRKNLFGEKWLTEYCLEFVIRNKHEMGFESDRNTYLNSVDFYSIAPGYFDRSEYIVLKDVSYNGEVYIYDNMYAYYSWTDGKFFGIEIENEALAETQKKIFETFWNLVITTKVYKQIHPNSKLIVNT